MAEIKSFRISDETKERLEALSAAIGGNKDRVFNALMDSYALEQEKNALSDQAKSVETFEQYANTLVRLYLEALRAISSSDERIRGEFHHQLEENAQTVRELRQERDRLTKEMSAIKEDYQKEKKEWEREQEQLGAQIRALKGSLAAAQEQAAAKQAMNDVLLSQVRSGEDAEAQCSSLKKRCEELQKQIDGQAMAAAETKQQLEERIRTISAEKEKASYEAEIAKQEAIRHAEEAVRTQKETELADMRKQLLSLQESLQSAKTQLLSVRLELSEKYQKELDTLRTLKDQKLEELQNELIKHSHFKEK